MPLSVVEISLDGLVWLVIVTAKSLVTDHHMDLFSLMFFLEP
jgi:hypothetical protein